MQLDLPIQKKNGLGSSQAKPRKDIIHLMFQPWFNPGADGCRFIHLWNVAPLWLQHKKNFISLDRGSASEQTLPLASTNPGDPRNFDMKSLYENGWPFERLITNEGSNGRHSDFQEVAHIHVSIVRQEEAM
jgi:hypothetical protein